MQVKLPEGKGKEGSYRRKQSACVREVRTNVQMLLCVTYRIFYCTNFRWIYKFMCILHKVNTDNFVHYFRGCLVDAHTQSRYNL